jgi:hypothetical protein
MPSSYSYRINRMKKLSKHWGLKLIHPLMSEYKIPNELFLEFKFYLKNYLCEALEFAYEENDNVFISKLNSRRNFRKNVTPNGAIVPKREFNLEYNLFLRSWCKIINSLSGRNLKILRYFRMTPNIRVKYGKELEDNISRGLNTSYPHSDAWVEGPWGMNCFCPVFGDAKNNNLKFYKPIKFEDSFLKRSKSYTEMQWVLKYYKAIPFVPKKGHVYISDYALIHNTMRKKNAKTRVSIDSTVFVDKIHNPPSSRIKEYRNKIPLIGSEEIIDSGQYADDVFSEKKNIFTHYTATSSRIIKL